MPFEIAGQWDDKVQKPSLIPSEPSIMSKTNRLTASSEQKDTEETEEEIRQRAKNSIAWALRKSQGIPAETLLGNLSTTLNHTSLSAAKKQAIAARVSEALGMDIYPSEEVLEGPEVAKASEAIVAETTTPEEWKALRTAMKETEKWLEDQQMMMDMQSGAEEIRTFLGNPDLYNGEAMFQAALDAVAAETDVSALALRALVENPATEEFVQKSLEERYVILGKVADQCLRQERKFLLNEMDIKGMENDIHGLIQSMQVSDEQKTQWEHMLSLDIPKGANIKIVSVLGGEGFGNTREHEQESLISAFKTRGANVTAVVIDNLTKTKQEILKEYEREVTTPGFDIFIPVFSTHGATPSLYIPGGGEMGFSEINAPDDTFLSENTVARTKADEKMKTGEYHTQAQILTDQYFTANPEPIHIQAGNVVKIGNFVIRCHENITSREALINKVIMFLIFKDIQDNSVTTNDLKSIQERSTRQNSSQFLYIFDACFSGSATDDALANISTTKAILSSSAETELSRNRDGDLGGEFINSLCEGMALGQTLGEAFVRTDMLLNYTRGPRSKHPNFGGEWQNPRAMLNNNGMVEKVSTIEKKRKDGIS